MNKFITPLVIIISLFAASCGEDDTTGIPTNAIALNMLIDNEDTTIGESDVYINTALNFTSREYRISDLGTKSGFGLNPVLSQIGPEVAVTPGNYYQVVRTNDLRYVAGERAFSYRADYYNVYVDSWIHDNNEIEGARVRYAECRPASKYLPAWDSSIEITLKENDNVETGTYSFDKNVCIDPDYTVYDYENSNLKDHLDIKIEGNRFIFSNSAWTPGGKVEIIAYIRSENLYTRVQIIVKSPY